MAKFYRREVDITIPLKGLIDFSIGTCSESPWIMETIVFYVPFGKVRLSPGIGFPEL
jgi:hypothetical protein